MGNPEHTGAGGRGRRPRPEGDLADEGRRIEEAADRLEDGVERAEEHAHEARSRARETAGDLDDTIADPGERPAGSPTTPFPDDER
jgi:hypothetical protein